MNKHVPDYYPFNSYKTRTIDIDMNRIVPIIRSVKALVASLEKDTLVLEKREQMISEMLEMTKESLKKEIVYIKEKVDNIQDLLDIIDRYRTDCRDFSVDMKTLRRLEEPLKLLDQTIGMETVKVQIFDQIVSSLQHLYDNDQMFHTVIQGPPGVGKTMLAKILGDIYSKMGIFRSDKYIFKIATRSDLVGRYLGHTAKLTQEFIDSCDGGVMFIDEVYSLGSSEKRDSFSKECIDTLNLNLTKNRNFVCIVAGYPEEIENCFFSYNAGLKRRFPFTFTVKSYTPEQLKNIFVLKVKNMKWNLSVSDNELIDFFTQNIDEFPHFGGDIENLITNIRTVHGRRVFGKNEDVKNINKDDLLDGFNKFVNFKHKVEIEDKPAFSMYC